MAKIKVILEENEHWDDVREDLAKAFIQDQHLHIDTDHRPFPDPVLQDLHQTITSDFSQMYNDMFSEIQTVIRNPHLQDLK